MSTGFDDDELRDARLRRALEHAPDAGALPDPRTREAIRKMAHNLAAATPPAAAPTAQPWWRRLFGGGGPRGRMPWNAAFATLLVVGFVTVLWRQEPVPDARLDGEARVGGAVAEAPPAPREVPAVVPEARPEAAAPAAPVAPVAPAAPSGAAAEAAGNADAVRRPSAPAAAAQRAPAPQAERRQAPAEPAAKSRESASLERAAPAPATPPPAAAAAVAPPPPEVAAAPVAPAPPPPAAVAPPPAAVAPPSPSAPAPVIAAAPPAPGAAPPVADAAPGAAPLAAEQSYKKSESERASVRGAASALQSVPPALSYAPPQPSAAAPSAQLSQAEPAALPPPSRARLAVERAPSFAALDRWTAWSAAGDTSPRHGRADIEAFPALLGAVARSATQPDAALAAPVEARIALYRGRTVVAVLEIAGEQVRWSPQPGASAFIGTPPVQALASLRAALERARETPSTPQR